MDAAPMLVRVADYMNAEQLREWLFKRAPMRAEQREQQVFEYLRDEGRRIHEQFGIIPVMGGAISAGYTVCSASAFAATTGAKTALNAIAPAGHGLAVVEFGASFDGVTGTAVPALCDICQSTQAGAGTSGETPTITQVRGRATGGSAPTGGSKYSAEPTTLTRTKPLYVSQYMGTYAYQYPLGRETECDSSAGTIKALAARVNVSANVNFVGWLEVEAVG